MSTRLNYFVTGATGLIGKELLLRLLARGGNLYLLVRRASIPGHRPVLDSWREAAKGAGGDLIVVPGEISRDELEIDDPAALPPFHHVFHLAGCYDLEADPDKLEQINVEGTTRLIQFLRSRRFGGILHHVSSVAVAGDHAGLFKEEDLDRGQGHPHPYLRSKFKAEVHVRALSDLRHRIYRPSAVVGHSLTGAMDRADGPYLLFRPLLKLRNALPPWFPLPGISSHTFGPINMVPVDFVAEALDALAHADGLDGQTFHLVDPDPPSFRETFNLLAAAAGAPKMSRRLTTRLLKYFPGIGSTAGHLGGVKFYRQQIRRDLGIPGSVFKAINHEVRFDTKNTTTALAEKGIRCPGQAEYIPQMWDYWLRNLNPERDPALLRAEFFKDKTVLITGASSGVGESLAMSCADAGAQVLLVARREEELRRVAKQCRRPNRQASYYVADLSDMDSCDELVQRVLADHDQLDILVNNAARSIRRPLAESLERFHDFERVMRLNFFGSVRLIRGFLPGMRERRSGHIVNVLTAGTVIPTPLFGAYGASKAALHHLTDTAAAEFLAENVHFSGVYLPFVRTPMMDAKVYDEDTRTMSAEEAAHWIMDGVVHRRRHVMDKTTIRRAVFNSVTPNFTTRMASILYRIYGQEEGANPELAMDRMLLKRLFKGRLM